MDRLQGNHARAIKIGAFAALLALVAASVVWKFFSLSYEKVVVANAPLVHTDDPALTAATATESEGAHRINGGSQLRFTCELHEINDGDLYANATDLQCIENFLKSKEGSRRERISAIFDEAKSIGLSTPKGRLLLDALGSTKPIELVSDIISAYYESSDEGKVALLRLLDRAFQVNLEDVSAAERSEIGMDVLVENSEILQHFIQAQIGARGDQALKLEVYALAANSLPDSYRADIAHSLQRDSDISIVEKQPLIVRLGVFDSDSQNDVLIPAIHDMNRKPGTAESARFNTSLASAFLNPSLASSLQPQNTETVINRLVDAYHRHDFVDPQEDASIAYMAVSQLAGGDAAAKRLLSEPGAP